MVVFHPSTFSVHAAQRPFISFRRLDSMITTLETRLRFHQFSLFLLNTQIFLIFLTMNAHFNRSLDALDGIFINAPAQRFQAIRFRFEKTKVSQHFARKLFFNTPKDKLVSIGKELMS